MLVVLGVANSNAQSPKKAKTIKKNTTVDAKAAPSKSIGQKIDGAGMLFESEVIDYGTIPHNADGNREFVFTNNGTKPLIITNTQGSCGCTVPTTPKEPIAPGAKENWRKYATDRVGPYLRLLL